MVKRTKKDINEEEDEALDLLIGRFKNHTITYGRYPKSVLLFMEEMGQSEDLFLKHYSSFKDLEASIWTSFINETIETIKNDSVYIEYGAQERLLAFYYTLIELLKKDRGYIKMTLKRLKQFKVNPVILKKMRMNYLEFVQEIISEGLANNEIANRPIITDQYKNALIQQLIFVLGFWIRDSSDEFEKTDAAIEKAVGLSFELMKSGPLDAIFDFAKFIYQNR